MIDIKKIPISQYSLWDKTTKARTLLSCTIELTARCNNNCPHCYINISDNNSSACKNELSFNKIKKIIDEAISLGAIWFLLTGGEPLLRNDFCDIYTYLKKKGTLVSIFTNASLISDKHIELFKKMPPRDIEISIYGVTAQTHKSATRSNTFDNTMKGINKLINASIPVSLKTTVFRSNYKEFHDIAKFCKANSKSAFRFDPFLNLRIDRDIRKNKRIIQERLTPDEIIKLEQRDPARCSAIKKKCHEIESDKNHEYDPGQIFHCKAGINSCYITYDGIFKLCSSLVNKQCVFDLKKGSLADAWNNFAPQVMSLKSTKDSFKNSCGTCNIISLCPWCPAFSDLETGEMDNQIAYFCELAKKRISEFYKP